MISVNKFLYIGFLVTIFILYFWNRIVTDQWRRPLILIGSIFFIFLSYYFILTDIYTTQYKTDSMFLCNAMTSVCLGGFAISTAYSKRKIKKMDSWRFPLIFFGGIMLLMFGGFLWGILFFSLKYAPIFIGVIGGIEVLISLNPSIRKSNVKWLFSLTLIGGLITIIFGVVTYSLALILSI